MFYAFFCCFLRLQRLLLTVSDKIDSSTLIDGSLNTLGRSFRSAVPRIICN